MEQQPRRRRRPALSCIECRRRKIKCDRDEPCNNCKAAKSRCNYRTYDHNASALRQSPRVQPSGSGVNQLDFTYSHVPSRDSDSATAVSSTDGGGDTSLISRLAALSGTPTVQQDGTGHHTLAADAGRAARPNVRDLLRRIEKLEQSQTVSLDRDTYQVSAGSSLPGETVLRPSQLLLNKTRLVAWNCWKIGVHEMRPVLTCYVQAIDATKRAAVENAGTRALLAQMGDLLRTSKDIAKRIKMSRPGTSLADPELGLTTPMREVADRLAPLYFSCFESAHRILHIPSFWADYKRFWDAPDEITTPSRLKILLVIGIGSSVDEDRSPDSDVRFMVHQWVHAAESWLSGPLKKDRLDLHGIQIYCLTILARQIFCIGGDLVWTSMGALVHRAMQIGLHRDPTCLPSMSVLQAELRRRLWWTVLDLLAQSSFDSTMPPGISFDEFDTALPSNVNDDELSESTEAFPHHAKDVFTNTSMQLQLLDSLPTRLRILKLLFGLRSDVSYIEVLKLTSDTLDACRKADGFLRQNQSLGITAFHRNLLDFLIRRFLLPLHTPFTLQARTNPLFHYSIKTSMDNAMAIIYPTPDDHYTRFMTISGGMIKSTMRGASNLLSHELLIQSVEGRRDDRIPANHSNGAAAPHQATAAAAGHLKKIMSYMIDFSIQRIREGETNVKAPMFLSQVLALVEARETEAEAGTRIAQSGVDSLRAAVKILQERIDAMASPYAAGQFAFTPTAEGSSDSAGLGFDLDFFLGDADFLVNSTSSRLDMSSF